MLGLRYGRLFSAVMGAVVLLASCASGAAASDSPLEQMKAKLASTGVGDRPRLCVQIAEHQLEATGKLYAANDVDHGQAAMTDVVAYSELARDYAVQSHKYQKQTEIAVRTMARKLGDIKHLVAHADEGPIQDAINRLQRVRDDLLMAMFPKGMR